MSHDFTNGLSICFLTAECVIVCSPLLLLCNHHSNGIGYIALPSLKQPGAKGHQDVNKGCDYDPQMRAMRQSNGFVCLRAALRDIAGTSKLPMPQLRAGGN